MRYELIENSDVGVIVDPTPILRDVKDTFSVSFVLPCGGSFVALFRDDAGIEYRATIKDGEVKIPKQLLAKEQIIGLTVCKIDDEKIVQSWECHPLKVGAFLSLRQTQRQITSGVDDRELYARLAELERAQAQTLSACAALKADFASCTQSTAALVKSHAERLDAACGALASVKSTLENLASAHNDAINVINDISRRIALLEKHYDPTLID